jgi:hypothetical protein
MTTVGHKYVFQYNMEDVISNSYKDFHAKGMDYICLTRSPEQTLKFYLLDGDVTKIPEVVNPHDHRYAFETQVLAGKMFDHRYMIGKESENALSYQLFDYKTPLNGGDGFTFKREEWLKKYHTETMEAGGILFSKPTDIHTIQMGSDQVILCLRQFKDVIPIDQPTSTWVHQGLSKPDLTGLYSQFTPDEVRDRIKKIQSVVRFTIEEKV